MPEIEEIFSELYDLTADVSESKHQYFASNLRRWFALLDGTPEISILLMRLEYLVDFDQWEDEGLVETPGMGHGKIMLPERKEQRLGIQIGLFRSISKDEEAPKTFAHSFVSSERNYNDLICDLVEQFFDPFARDLRRYIEQNLGSSGQIPASDRIVTPDHNSAEFLKTISAIEETEKVLRETNDYLDDDDRKQRLAELEAGKVLLKSPRFRIQAIWEVIQKCLTYLAKKFSDNLIGRAAGIALTALAKYFSNFI